MKRKSQIINNFGPSFSENSISEDKINLTKNGENVKTEMKITQYTNFDPIVDPTLKAIV